jgi:hypothetical protein
MNSSDATGIHTSPGFLEVLRYSQLALPAIFNSIGITVQGNDVKLYFAEKRANQFDYLGRPVQELTDSDGQPQANVQTRVQPRGRPGMTDFSSRLREPS